MPPSALDASLVGQYIAFNHVEGWDAGKLIAFYEAGRWKQGFNYDIEYYRRPRTGSQRALLLLARYGMGSDGNVPLSSWVLLTERVSPRSGAQKQGKYSDSEPQKKRKKRRKT